MENATRVNSSTTNVKEMELSFGLTDAVISEDGDVVNKMVPELTSIKMARRETEYGRMVKKCSGLTKTPQEEMTALMHEFVPIFRLADA